MALQPLFDKRLSLPLIAAPMFLASGPELVIACCRAGIVGTFPAKNQRTLDGLEAWLRQITENLAAFEAETGHQAAPFGVNLIVHKSNTILADELALCRRFQVPLIITSLGAVSDLVAAVHDYGGIVYHDIASLRHANKAAAANVDGIIAVSAGAGGHSGQASPFGLVSEIKKGFDGTVILSGAMSTGADIAAAQTMGADLAYMGTRFISTAEAASSQAYKDMLLAVTIDDIILTDRLTGVNANFIRQSLEQAGLNPDDLAAHGNIDINKELDDAHNENTGSARPWRDLWSAGHGVGQIADCPPVADLVGQMRDEYRHASSGQYQRSLAYF